MRNAGLDKAQAGTKIAGRNINNLRNADTTLMAAISFSRASFQPGDQTHISCIGR